MIHTSPSRLSLSRYMSFWLFHYVHYLLFLPTFVFHIRHPSDISSSNHFTLHLPSRFNPTFISMRYGKRALHKHFHNTSSTRHLAFPLFSSVFPVSAFLDTSNISTYPRTSHFATFLTSSSSSLSYPVYGFLPLPRFVHRVVILLCYLSIFWHNFLHLLYLCTASSSGCQKPCLRT